MFVNTILMSKLRIPENFSLEGFARDYVSIALELAGKRMTTKEFDDTLNPEVSRRVGIPLELVRVLHHPFHWTFFLSSNGSLISWHKPERDYVSSLQLMEMSREEIEERDRRLAERVVLKRGYGSEDIDYMAECVLNEYGDLLSARVRSYAESNQ